MPILSKLSVSNIVLCLNSYEKKITMKIYLPTSCSVQNVLMAGFAVEAKYSN